MHYGKIIYYDTGNGLGCRTTLFVSGCRHHCKNCFNPMTWDFQYGIPYTKDVKRQILKSLQPDYIQGLTILGGEPFEPENQEDVLDLVTSVKKKYPNKNIWIYSGYTWDELMGETCEKFQHMSTETSIQNCKNILKQIDILVDGEFKEELYNIALKFKGSSNQRIIDVKETLERDVMCEIKL